MKIFRNIEYKPQIWGIAFTHLMIVIILTMLSFLLFSIFGRWIQVVFGMAMAIFSYAFFYTASRIDKAEMRARFFRIGKKKLTPYSMSSQRIVIKDFKAPKEK